MHNNYNLMNKKILFIYTETTGLHQINQNVCKKKLYAFARLVCINYEIGSFINNQFISDKKVRTIIKPNCMNIPEDTIKFHNITQEYAINNGINPDIVINTFKEDIKNVDIIVSHNVHFHLRTILAEAVRYNINIDLSKYIIIDTINFQHKFDYIKLKELAKKLDVEINQSNVDLIKNVFIKLYLTI